MHARTDFAGRTVLAAPERQFGKLFDRTVARVAPAAGGRRNGLGRAIVAREHAAAIVDFIFGLAKIIAMGCMAISAPGTARSR